MKKLGWVLISGVLLSLDVAMADTNSKCPGEQGYYYINARRRNPTAGGFVSHNAFVDDTDDIFIAPTATVCGSSHVSDRAKVYGTAAIKDSTVSGSAEVFGQARILDGAEVTDQAKVSEDALVSGSVRIYGKAIVAGTAKVINNTQDELAQVFESARVTGGATVRGNAQIHGSARVMGNSVISGDAIVNGNAFVTGYTKLKAGTMSSGTKNDPDYEGIAKAKRDAEIAEEKRKAAELKAEQDRLDKLNADDQARKLREANIKRYNEIIKFLVNERFLEDRNQKQSSSFPEICKMETKWNEYRERRVYASGWVDEKIDRIHRVIVNFKTLPKFKTCAEESEIYGTNCIYLNLYSSPGGSLIETTDRLTGRTSSNIQGAINFPVSGRQQFSETKNSWEYVGPAEVKASLIEMTQICNQLSN